MVNQLGKFTHTLAESSKPIRDLLKVKCGDFNLSYFSYSLSEYINIYFLKKMNTVS